MAICGEVAIGKERFMENQFVLKGNAMNSICFVLTAIGGSMFPEQNVVKFHKYEEEDTGKFLCFIKNISWRTRCGPPVSWIPTAG